MKGFPKYKIGDKVHFELIVDDKKYSENGEVVVVDKYGTRFDNSDVSYDTKHLVGTYDKAPEFYRCLDD